MGFQIGNRKENVIQQNCCLYFFIAVAKAVTTMIRSNEKCT